MALLTVIFNTYQDRLVWVNCIQSSFEKVIFMAFFSKFDKSVVNYCKLNLITKQGICKKKFKKFVNF